MYYRQKGGKFGFAETVSANKITVTQKPAEPLDVSTVDGQRAESFLRGSDDDEMDSDVVSSEYPFSICIPGLLYYVNVV